MNHVFSYVEGFGEAGFAEKRGKMVCYIARVGGMSKDFDSCGAARRFVRWFAGEEGEPGESEQYSIVRVTFDAAAARPACGESYSASGVVDAAKHVSIVERGRVFYASAA